MHQSITVPIGDGYEVIVDVEDLPIVAMCSWQAVLFPRSQTRYARGKIADPSGKRKQVPVLMHRVIIGAADGVQVDHINGNGLDNRRCNLRFATNTQNRWNTGKHRDNQCGYLGVAPDGNRWRARITNHGKRTHLGLYATPEEAARAFDAAARATRGEFAAVNFPD